MFRTAILAATLVLLGAGLAGLPPPALGAGGDAFSPPPILAGSTLAYATTSPDFPTLSYAVGAPTQTWDKTGRLVDVLPIARDVDGFVEHLSPATMTLESAYRACAVGTRDASGRCSTSMRAYTWVAQGAPAALGASFLQGRTFRVGDAWDVAGECACSWRRVVIEAPDPDSPPGTAYVARIRGDYPSEQFVGRIHMGTAHAFPLRADWSIQQRTDTLVAYVPGAVPVVPPSPPVPASHAPLLPVLPYESNRPVEGTPSPGFPAWSDARDATGTDPAATPGARFVRFAHVPASATLRPLGTDDVEVAQATLSARYARPGGQDVVTEYERTEVSLAGSPVHGVWQAWSADASPTALAACPDVSVPMWDGVRLSLGLGLLGNLTGFHLDARGAGCAGALLVTEGDPLPEQPLFVEHASLQARTGHLSVVRFVER